MRGKHTIVINGKVYDAVTGLPVAAPDPVSTVQKPAVVAAKPATSVVALAPNRSTHHAKNAHTITKKSSTLRRDVLKKPAAPASIAISRRKPQAGHISKSDKITRFAPHPQPLQKTHQPKAQLPRLDVTPVKTKPSTIVTAKQSLVSRAHTAPTQPLSSRALKEQLIKERLASVQEAPTAAPDKSKKSFLQSRPRLMSIVTASFAIMVIGGYLTYLNMPGLSVRVAASQADVAATFPDYHPDGYRFNGPVAFAPGQVAINFVANGGTSNYTVTEQKSTWDSQAVYDNIVASVADNSYVTNSQQGLTIYTFKGDAAWVNKGILYTVQGDAPLSNEQLLRIAGSL